MILTEKQVLELARNMVGQAGTLNQIAPRMGVDVDELRLDGSRPTGTADGEGRSRRSLRSAGTKKRLRTAIPKPQPQFGA